MAFPPTPVRSNAPSQLLPLSAIAGISNVVAQPVASITLSSSPVSGTSGAVLQFGGAVAPAGSAVQVGLSTSSSTAPGTWTNATVSGAGWSVSLTPSAAGTYYLWARQTNAVSVQVVSLAIAVASASVGTIGFTSPPTTGTAGAVIAVAGTVSPSAALVQVGLSTSSTVAPTIWTNATVSGVSWTASLTAASAGTYYLWAEQTSSTSVRAVSAAVTIAAAGGSALSYSLISSSGNNSLTGVTLTTLTSAIYAPAPAVDWTSSIAVGANDVEPNVLISSLGSVTAAKFWWDANNTGTAVGSVYANCSSVSNGAITFYPASNPYPTPTEMPPAPSTAGTYYGKYAMYNSSAVLLGVFVTSAITVH